MHTLTHTHSLFLPLSSSLFSLFLSLFLSLYLFLSRSLARSLARARARARSLLLSQAHELGATLVANHDVFTTHIIAMCRDQKFENLKKNDFDIISFMYVFCTLETLLSQKRCFLSALRVLGIHLGCSLSFISTWGIRALSTVTR